MPKQSISVGGGTYLCAYGFWDKAEDDAKNMAWVRKARPRQPLPFLFDVNSIAFMRAAATT